MHLEGKVERRGGMEDDLASLDRLIERPIHLHVWDIYKLNLLFGIHRIFGLPCLCLGRTAYTGANFPRAVEQEEGNLRSEEAARSGDTCDSLRHLDECGERELGESGAFQPCDSLRQKALRNLIRLAELGAVCSPDLPEFFPLFPTRVYNATWCAFCRPSLYAMSPFELYLSAALGMVLVVLVLRRPKQAKNLPPGPGEF